MIEGHIIRQIHLDNVQHQTTRASALNQHRQHYRSNEFNQANSKD